MSDRSDVDGEGEEARLLRERRRNEETDRDADELDHVPVEAPPPKPLPAKPPDPVAVGHGEDGPRGAHFDVKVLRDRAASCRRSSYGAFASAVLSLFLGVLGFLFVGQWVIDEKQSLTDQIAGNARTLSLLKTRHETTKGECARLRTSVDGLRDDLATRGRLPAPEYAFGDQAWNASKARAALLEAADKYAAPEEKPTLVRAKQLEEAFDKAQRDESALLSANAAAGTTPGQSPAEAKANKRTNAAWLELLANAKKPELGKLLTRAVEESERQRRKDDRELRRLEDEVATCNVRIEAQVKSINDLEVGLGEAADFQKEDAGASPDASVADGGAATASGGREDAAAPGSRDRSGRAGAPIHDDGRSALAAFATKTVYEVVVLRVGMLVFAFALLRMLLGLHKSLLDNANFYDARADAILLLREAPAERNATFGPLEKAETRLEVAALLLPRVGTDEKPGVPTEKFVSAIVERVVDRLVPSAGKPDHKA